MKTLEAINKKIEDNQDTFSRDYLGFSEIGDKCSRKLWYSYNNYKKAPYTADTLKKFEDGHRGEELMAKRIRDAGIELWGTQSAFAIGNFRGHCDGLIKPLEDPVPHVWEHKCTEKPPKPNQDLKDWNYQYYCQAQMYMHASGIYKHYMTISTAGERKTVDLFTAYNPALVDELILKADYIMNTETPPDRISQTPAFYYCKCMCPYNEECHAKT